MFSLWPSATALLGGCSQASGRCPACLLDRATHYSSSARQKRAGCSALTPWGSSACHSYSHRGFGHRLLRLPVLCHPGPQPRPPRHREHPGGSPLTEGAEVERSSQGFSPAGAERDPADIAGLHGRTPLISQQLEPPRLAWESRAAVSARRARRACSRVSKGRGPTAGRLSGAAPIGPADLNGDRTWVSKQAQAPALGCEQPLPSPASPGPRAENKLLGKGKTSQRFFSRSPCQAVILLVAIGLASVSSGQRHSQCPGEISTGKEGVQENSPLGG